MMSGSSNNNIMGGGGGGMGTTATSNNSNMMGMGNNNNNNNPMMMMMGSMSNNAIGIGNIISGTGVGGLQNEQAVIRKAGREAIRQFLDSHNCFAVLRTSGKVVVFDTRIPIQLAFYALVEHDMLVAPLWDPFKCQFVGLLTVTDFIDILRHYKACKKDVSTLAIHSIAEIISSLQQSSSTSSTGTTDTTTSSLTTGTSTTPRGSESTINTIITNTGSDNTNVHTRESSSASVASGASSVVQSPQASSSTPTAGGAVLASASSASLKQQQQQQNHQLQLQSQQQHQPVRTFQGADSSCTLRQACEQLLANHQDFLPIVFTEDMRVLACITFTTILEHLVMHFREQRRLFDDSIIDLKIGTYTNVITITKQHTLAQALELMYQYNLSALPVVEEITAASSSGSGGSETMIMKKKIVGVYSRSDITFLTKAMDAEDAVRNLDMTIGDILLQNRTDVTTPDALRTCSPSHTLQAIFESFAQLRFNRLYVVDPNDDTLLGTVSARDLVSYFLRTDNNNNNNTIRSNSMEEQ